MEYALSWLADVLRQAGLKVEEQSGWKSRGRREMGTVKGVICHHTAGALTGDMPTLKLLIEGRSDLPGPLSQLGLGRDGTYYVIAAGVANHAGAGSWQGETDGNGHFIGIEAENTGETSGPRNDSPWPQVQMDAYRRGVAAILSHLGQGVEWCCGHKEYAPKRKTDPSFDMDEFRKGVSALLGQPAPTPPASSRPTLRRGDSGDAVTALQTLLKLNPADGTFGPATETAVRAAQAKAGLTQDGIAGPKTWAAIGG